MHPRLLLFLSIFRDIDNLVLEDEKIRTVVARNAHHILVVVLNPAADDFPVGQLQTHDLLFFSQRFQIGRFFERLIRRRSSLLVRVGIS